MLLLLGFLVFAACDSLPGKPTEADRPLRPDQVVDFAVLYGENCAGCHGADGKLGAARPLNDAVYLTVIGADRLRQIAADGVANSLMPGFGPAAGGSLTDQQVDLVVSGMISRWGSSDAVPSARPAYAAPAPGDAPRGATVYAAACAGCHGVDGAGGKKGGSIVDSSYLALVSEQALRSAVLFGRPDLGMPDWRGSDGRPLSEQDVADVVAWMMARRVQFPGQPYSASAASRPSG